MWSEEEIMSIQMGPNQGDEIRKAVLSPEEFPELYGMNAKQLWLKKRAYELRRKEMLEKMDG